MCIRDSSYPVWYRPYSVTTTVGQDLWRLWCRNTGNPATYTRRRLQGISFQISSDAWWNKKQPVQSRQYAIRVIIQFAWNQYGYWSGMVTEKPEKFQNQYRTEVTSTAHIYRLSSGSHCLLRILSDLSLSEAPPKNDLLFASLSIRRELEFP